MGKRVLFHPVGLFVIRGALEKAGYGVARLRQIGLSEDSKHAKYSTEITNWPRPTSEWSPEAHRNNLNHFFAADLAVTKCWRTKYGKLMCEIETWIDGNPALQPTLPLIAEPIRTVKDGFVVEPKKRRKNAVQ